MAATNAKKAVEVETVEPKKSKYVHKNPSSSEMVYTQRREAKTVSFGADRVKVLVWQLPVRIWHWIDAFAIFALIITGLYIGKPFISAASVGEANFSFLMGWIRIIHFAAGFIFIAGLFVRLYWAFAGNKYSTFNITKKGFFKELLETIKYYMFLKNKKPHFVGHNPLAQFAYWIIFGVCGLILSFTGLYLYAEPQQGSLLAKLISWVTIFGDSSVIRSIHHFAMWGVIIFIVLHIYMAFREDYLERNATMSSIFSGWKIEKKKNVYGEKNERSK